MTGVELFTLGTTAITLGDVLTVGSFLTGAFGSSQTYNAEAAAAEYNARIARIEAQAEEDRIRRQASRELGAIRANIGKSGVTGEGTPLLVLAESAELAELDAQNVRYMGEHGARLYEQRARSARKAIPYSIGASLLSGAGSLGARSMSTKSPAKMTIGGGF